MSDWQQHTEWKVVETAKRRHSARPYTTAAIAWGALTDRVSNSRAPNDAGATHSACVNTFAMFSTWVDFFLIFLNLKKKFYYAMIKK